MERYKYTPSTEFHEDKPTIAIVDISSLAKSKARDVANEKSTETTEKPKGFLNKLKHFGKTIWKRSELHNTLERYKAEEAIKNSGNLFISEKDGGQTEAEKKQKEENAKQAHDATVKAVTERFTTKKEFEKDFIHEGAGEHRSELHDGELKKEIINLVKRYAKGDLTQEAFFTAKTELLDKKVTAGLDSKTIDKGKLFADNIFEAAKWAKDYVKKQVEQGLDEAIALNELDEHFKVVVGRARDAVRTEAHNNAIDKITDKIQKWTGGSLNEAAVAAGVAAVYGATGKIVEGSLKKAATVFGAGMLASGAAGALRESRKLEQERMQHAREKAQGKEVKGDKNKAKRREEMEDARIQFKKADVIAAELDSQIFKKLESKDITEFTEAEFQLAMQTLADLESRTDLSDWGLGEKGWLNKNKKYAVDLIGYSSEQKAAEEQGRLDIAKARAKVLLKQYAQAKGKNFEQDFKNVVKLTTENLLNSGDKGINQQAERFAKMKKEKIRKVFVKSALMSGAIGIAVQEIRAAFDDQIEGAGEHIWNEIKGNHHIPKAGERTTLVEGAYRRGKELFNEIFPTTSGSSHDTVLNGHKFRLDGDFEFQGDSSTANPNDYYLVDKAGNKVSEKLQLNPDGTLTTSSEKWLKDHGFALSEIAGSKTTAGIHNLNSAETLAKFPGLTHNIREDWHDEPGQFWSEIHKQFLEFEGKQQMGYLEKVGDKVYLNASKVIANFEEELRERVNDPNFGQVAGYENPDGTPFVDSKMMHLKDQIIQAMNSGTLREHFQATVIPTEGANHDGLSDMMQGADENGRIYLGPEWSKYFTKPEHLKDGHLPFRFLELRYDGHTMGTARGFAEEALTPPVTVIGHPDVNQPFEVVPPIPMYREPRKGLEEMEPSKTRILYTPKPPVDSRSYGPLSREQVTKYKERFSLRLRENPDANLDHYSEIEDYFNRMEPGRLLRTKALAGQAGEMNRDISTAVCIPVAGHQEGANIYNTLKNYTNQSLDRNKFELVLFVNHPAVDRQGNKIEPDATLTEIQRFQKDYPDMNVKVMYEVLPIEEAKIGNIRKLLNDAVLWRHHSRGKNVPDLIMVSNDADNKGVAVKYLENFVIKFDENPKTDAFLGQVDWDPESYIKNPLMHIGTRLFQLVDAQTRKRDASQIQSSGANFAFRSSIYAAVGGYDNTDTIAEDVVLGASIKLSREGTSRQAIQFAGANVSRLYSNSRRALAALEKGKSPIEQWNSGFSAFDDEVRKFTVKENGVDYNNPKEVAALITSLEQVLNRTLGVLVGQGNPYWKGTPTGAEINRALNLLGIQYETQNDGSIKISDASKLIAGLQKYKEDGLKIMEAKIVSKITTAVEKNKGSEPEIIEDVNKAKEKNNEEFEPVQIELDKIIDYIDDDGLDDDEVAKKVATGLKKATKAGSKIEVNSLVNFMNSYLESRIKPEKVATRFLPGIERYAENKEREKQRNLIDLRNTAQLVYRVAMNDTLTDRRASENILRVLKDSEKYREGLSKDEISEAMRILKSIPQDIWNRRVSPSTRGLEKSSDYPDFEKIKNNIASKWGINSVHYDLTGANQAEAETAMANLSNTFIKAKASSLRTQVFNKVFNGKTEAGLHIRFVSKGQKIGVKGGELVLPVNASQEMIQQVLEMSFQVEFKAAKAPVTVRAATRRRGK